LLVPGSGPMPPRARLGMARKCGKIRAARCQLDN
jgi:hypothetical protein